MTNSSRSSAASRFAGAGAVFALALCAVSGCGPSDGRQEYAEAGQAYETRNLVKAENLFAESARLDPSNVDALVMLVRARLDLGDLAGAKEAIARAAELAGDDRDVIELGAQVASHAKDYEGARALYLRLADAKNDPKVRSQALAGLGVVDMALNDAQLRSGSRPWMADRARVEFLQAITLNPGNAAARYHLGILYRDAFGYIDAALEQLQFYVKLATEADPRMQTVQRSVIPDLKDAIGATLANRPGAASRDSAASAAAIKKAEEAWKKGTYKTARQRYEEAFKADPLSYPAALGLAKAWEKTDASLAGRKHAYDAYRAACQLRASAVSTFLAAGDLAVKLGQHATAVEIYSRAVAASSKDVSAIDGLIRALRKTGNAEAANIYQAYRDTIPVNKRR